MNNIRKDKGVMMSVMEDHFDRLEEDWVRFNNLLIERDATIERLTAENRRLRDLLVSCQEDRED